MTALQPFFRYYGAKWRAVHAQRYPQPLHDTIIEPFAGAASYAMHWPERRVILVERYAVVAQIWRWLIGASRHDVLQIPLVDDVDDLPYSTPLGARYLVGFAMNAATASPRRSISASALKLRSEGRRFYGWSEDMRMRVANQVEQIKHWQIIEGDYTAAPDVEATWFVDQPYAGPGGAHYVHGSSGINYEHLAAWCRARRGQPIVCEAQGATWLPFRPMPAAKAGPRSKSSREAVWP